MHRDLRPEHVAGRGLLCRCGAWLVSLEGGRPCEPARAAPIPQGKRATLASAAARYPAAVERWIAAGRPERTQAEVEQLLEICRGCGWYDAGRCSHANCGCNLTVREARGWWASMGRALVRFVGLSPALFSKAAMRTERCPVDRWPAELIVDE